MAKGLKGTQFATIQDIPIKDKKVRIGTGFGLEANEDTCEISISFRLGFEADELPFIILQVSCLFSINPEDFRKFPVKNKTTLQVQKDFIAHLVFLTVGTARGNTS